MTKYLKLFTVFFVALFTWSAVHSETLTERLANGHKLRLGFGTAVPWAYAGDNGSSRFCKCNSFNCPRRNGHRRA